MAGAAQVSLCDCSGIVWTGSLDRFLSDNSVHAAEAAEIAERLDREGRATVGGGAAPLFTIIKVGA